jgi:hypothetical protein
MLSEAVNQRRSENAIAPFPHPKIKLEKYEQCFTKHSTEKLVLNKSYPL